MEHSTQNGATKHDRGKARLSLIPDLALVSEARVLGFGAKKYGDHNWRKGMAWSRLIDAAMRHLTAFSSGEDYDPETGEYHLAHLRACAGFLIEYAELGIGTDDRYSSMEGERFSVVSSSLGAAPEYPGREWGYFGSDMDVG